MDKDTSNPFSNFLHISSPSSSRMKAREPFNTMNLEAMEIYHDETSPKLNPSGLLYTKAITGPANSAPDSKFVDLSRAIENVSICEVGI